MSRYHLRRALRDAKLSAFEENALVTAALLMLAAFAAAVVAGAGFARVFGSGALVAVAAYAGSRAVRRYRAGAPAALPVAVGRSPVRARPRRLFSAITVALALGLPLALAVAGLVLVEWAWVVVAAVLLLGCAGGFAACVANAGDREHPSHPSELATELLRRLCIVADMPVPSLVIEPGGVASAWTTGGRIHVTQRALDLLDDAELEAVLAHELAHLAHRDAAVMDVCSAPSRVLLGFARAATPRRSWARACAEFLPLGIAAALVFLSALTVPPAFVLGWVSRFSVLGLSRARELSADAAAAALTGRPSALASALLKLDAQRAWAPPRDLRQYDAVAVLGIVGTARSRLGRLFSSHPPTADRVRRLEAIQQRARRV